MDDCRGQGSPRHLEMTHAVAGSGGDPIEQSLLVQFVVQTKDEDRMGAGELQIPCRIQQLQLQQQQQQQEPHHSPNDTISSDSTELKELNESSAMDMVYTPIGTAPPQILSLDLVHQKLLDGEASDDDKPVSEQTQPETPPPPSLSDNEYVRDELQVTRERDYDSSSNSSAGDEENSSNVYLDTHPFQEAYTGGSTTASAYNPMTCYSPNRRSPARREIMGMSVFSDSFVSTQPYPGLETVQSEDDSEVALEMAAQHIRTEMLHSEMLELAAEAERAADAGQDHFAAKPCAFHDDLLELLASSTTPDAIVPTPRLLTSSPRKLAMRRCQSEGSYAHHTASMRSSGGTMAKRRSAVAARLLDHPLLSTSSGNPTGGEKLSVVELRDVNEVFPSFRQFHTHLRTHFYRSKVEQGQLFFCESTSATLKTTTPKPSGSALFLSTDRSTLDLLPLCTNHSTATPIPRLRKTCRSRNSIDQVQANFLRTFSLDQWTGPSRSWGNSGRNANDDKDDSDFIHTLASEHFEGPTRPTPPKIDVPPGLLEFEMPDIPVTVHLRPKASRLQWDGQVWDPIAPSPHDVPRLSYVRSFSPTLDLCVVEPRALFDATDNDTDEMETSGSTNAGEGQLEEGNLKEATNDSHAILYEDFEPSTNSLVDEIAVSPSPTLRKRRQRRCNSILSPDGSTFPYSNPDFVTPARLRYIRGLRKASSGGPDAACPSLPELRSHQPSPYKPDFSSVVDMSDSFTRTTTEYRDVSTSIGSLQDILFDSPSRDVEIPPVPSPVPPQPALVEMKSFGSSESISLVEAVGLHRRQALTQLSIPACSPFSTPSTVIDPKPSSSLEYIHRLQGEFSRTLGNPPSPDSVQSIASAMAEHPKLRTPKALDGTLAPESVPVPGGFLDRSPSFEMTPSANAKMHGDARAEQSQTAFMALVQAASGNVARQSVLDDDGLLATPQQRDCSCLSLSPTKTISDDDSVESANHAHHSPTTLRRSTSTGALHDSGLWNDFMGRYDASRSPHQPISVAMNIISKLSPKHYRTRERALYTRVKENDDFMNNFLYCSKTPEEGEQQIAKAFAPEPCLDGPLSCGATNTGFCCTSFINDALTMGAVFHPRRNIQSRSLVTLSSSGVAAAAAQNRDHSWFDLATEHLDNVVDHWVDGSRHDESNFSVSFQAPSLRKCEDFRNSIKRPQGWTDTDEATVTGLGDDVKFDGIGLYDIETSEHTTPRRGGGTDRLPPRHAHHLSLLEDDFDSLSLHEPHNLDNTGSPVHHGGHSRHDLSDSQFAIMYGVTRQSFEAKAKAAHSFRLHPKT